MTPVRLRRQMVLERPEQVPDGAGGFSLVWVAVGQIWADVRPASGRDVGGEEVTLSSISYRVTLRAAPVGDDRRPVAGQRLREGGRRFPIVAVTERDDSGMYLTCHVREEEQI